MTTARWWSTSGDGNRPVDILDGRQAGDFADWLRAPGVKVSAATGPVVTPTPNR